MKFQKPIAIAVGVVVGCQLTTGCATTDSPEIATTPAAPPPVTANLQAPSPRVARVRTLPAEPIAFAAPQTTIATGNPQPSRRSPQLIGLYGELNDGSPNSGSPFDGGSNLGQVTFATEGACVDPDVDSTGNWLAFASTMHRNTSDIYIKSITGKTQTQITTDPADDVMPAFSPDGNSIAFASNRAGNWDVFTVGVDGGRTVQVTNDNDHELHPTWSPDGRMLAYCKFGSQSQRWERKTSPVRHSEWTRTRVGVSGSIFPRLSAR